MRRSFPIALLGLLAVAVSGFSTPATTTRRRQGITQPRWTTSRTTQSCPDIELRMTTDSDDGGSGPTEPEKTMEANFPASKEDQQSAAHAPLGTNNGDASSSSSIVESSPTAAAANPNTNINDSGSGFTLLLLPVLLFKFAVVMLVKFATDAVVFPLLWSYRLVRRGKRRIANLFGRGGKVEAEAVNGAHAKVNGEVNGDGGSSS